MVPKHSRTRHFLARELFKDLTSFQELESRIAQLPTEKERGDAFEVFAEAYLATQNIVQSQEVWPFSSVPVHILSQLAIDTGKDMGIDGVLKTRLGTYSAYQVKFRSARTPLIWSELSTFMGLSDMVEGRILLTNSTDLPALMNKRKDFYCIRGTDLDRMEQRDFEAILAWLSALIVPRGKKSPRPHQEKAVESILQALVDYDRATAVMACGTGKTLVALWVAEKIQAKNVLVILPSLSLLRQTLHEWLKETSLDKMTYLCVCSDKTVKPSDDDLKIDQSDLDFPVTTDWRVVDDFFGVDTAAPKVLFSTYHSLSVIEEAVQGKELFDLAIFDEAHKTAGKENTFNLGLRDENIPIRKRVFFTATPRHYNPHKKDDEGEPEVVYSMDNADVYGPIQYTLSFSEAARQNIICDYRIVISVITSETVDNELLRTGEVPVHGDLVRARQVATQLALRDAIKNHHADKILTFHASVASAKSYSSPSAEGVRSHIPGYDIFHVNGKMPTSVREKTMAAFQKTPKSLITNARCLTEGVDMPAVDMVAFMSPKRSLVDIVQAAGRAMRKSPGKTTGYILIPLFVELSKGESLDEAIQRAEFGEVWDVLQAMQEQDEVLEETVRLMNLDRGRTKGLDDSRFRKLIEIQGPEVSLDLLRASVTARCISHIGSSWDYYYGKLTAFKEANGHCNVVVGEDAALGRWAVSQRVLGRKNKLPQKRVQLLDDIGFDWNYQKTRSDAIWNEYYAKLLNYKEQHGNCNVPARYGDDPKLASWVWIQRQKYNGTYRDKLTDEQVELLNAAGFLWDAREDMWMNFFEQLKEFGSKHGHFEVPKDDPEFPGLAAWLQRQRQYRSCDARLPEERKSLFDSIGFEWASSADENAWHEKYAMLKEYRQAHGNCEVPAKYRKNPSLAHWVSTQRQFKRSGKLEEARIELLDQVDFSWFLRKREPWEEMFSRLVTFKEQNGHCGVPCDGECGKLGRWVGVQRRQKVLGKLPPSKMEKLESIGFEWRKRKTWEEMYSELVDYKSKHGHCNVPTAGEEHELGQWVATQRSLKGRGMLNEDRTRDLEAIGLKWPTPGKTGNFDQRWEAMFSELVRFQDCHGHCNVPIKGETKELGKWIDNQRVRWRSNKLDEARIARLNSIGLEWSPRKSALS